MSTSLHKFQQLKIGDVCIVNPRKDISQVSADFITFVPMESASPDGQIDTSKIISIEKAKNYTFFKEGDILFAKITPCMENGKGGIAKGLLNGYGAGSTEFIVLRPDPAILINKWLSLFLSQKSFRHECLSHTKGSAGQKRVPPSYIAHCSIPIPSTEEQERIISKIEELFSEIDNAVSSLKTVRQKIAAYQQIITENSFAELNKEDLLGNHLLKIESGKSFKCEERPPKSSECGIVKVSAVTWGRFQQFESKTCKPEQFVEKRRICKGDFLFSRANTIQLIGNCVIVDEIDKKLMLSDKILRFTFDESLLPDFALLYLMSGAAKKQIRSFSSGNQDGMRNISQDKIRKITIPLPPIRLQAKIVESVNQKIAACKKLEIQIDYALIRAAKLKQSVLKRAFEGTLL